MKYRFYFTIPNLKYHLDIDADSVSGAKDDFKKLLGNTEYSIKQILNMTTGEVIYQSDDFEDFVNGK